MAKDDRSPLNPFTGKEHYDTVDDDEFLAECYNAYYSELNQYELLDNTQTGQMVFDITASLIHAVEDYLQKINRMDYVIDYYDWEVHLVNSNIANACCYPGGKIIVYAGILEYMQYQEELAFILSHEISHALLDHSRTRASVEQTKTSLSSASWMGSIALDLMGFGAAGDLVRAGVNIADATSHYFLTQPWGRDNELEADKLGLIIAYLAGYDVSGVPVFWQRFAQDNANEFDFFSTHPSDEKRIAVMRESLMDMYNRPDFFSQPLLPETPKAKDEYKTSGMGGNNPGYDGFSAQDSGYQYNQADSNVSVHRFQVQYNCPGCNNPIVVGDDFCNSCGLNLKQLHCQNCGNHIFLTDNYCMHCGKKL
ncbi:MAG: M48 family metalloprotease [Methanosphaera sp.]|nr:M48 family metalloprotease [Methanosphaera sp.]